MDYRVSFFSDTGYLLGATIAEGASKENVIEETKSKITEEPMITAYPYGKEISLESVIVTSKIASFTIETRK